MVQVADARRGGSVAEAGEQRRDDGEEPGEVGAGAVVGGDLGEVGGGVGGHSLVGLWIGGVCDGGFGQEVLTFYGQGMGWVGLYMIGDMSLTSGGPLDCQV